MKILIVASEFPPGPGGIGNHAYSLAKHLAKIGYQVNLVVDSNYADKKEIEEFDFQLPHSIFINRVYRQGWKTYLNRVKYLAHELKSNKFDAVIFSGKFSLWLAGLYKSFYKKTPFLGVLHGSEVNIKGGFHRSLTNWGISRCDILLPVSKFTHSLLQGKLKNKKYRIIPNGIDVNEFGLLQKEMNGECFKLIGNPILLTVGTVTPRKGQHRVIKSLPAILKKYPDAHYHIVGLPSYKNKFSELAHHLKVKDSVTFHGRLPHRKNLADAYQQADCFMILSENQDDGDVEGFGIVILEANFFGLPAIGANGCGISDAINEGINGFLVDGDDDGLIRERLVEILEHKQEFKQGAKKWAFDHDWNNIVKDYNEVIEMLKS